MKKRGEERNKEVKARKKERREKERKISFS